jgi:hypothetical protein
MHMAKITTKKLAEASGYTPEYVSMVLNGHRDTKNARIAILSAIEMLETTKSHKRKGPSNERT